ncbi:hypothetical protein KJ557_02180 [Patescibacteria group bacterium]|nr:hypothetical protein [Patescibacteria group bacterium]
MSRLKLINRNTSKLGWEKTQKVIVEIEKNTNDLLLKTKKNKKVVIL